MPIIHDRHQRNGKRESSSHTYPNGPRLPLTPKHLADLRKSGLSDQQIERCAFHSLTTAAGVQQALLWRYGGAVLGDCLAIPFFDATGKLTGYVRLKPDCPRTGDNGKLIKYESPLGPPNRLYIPPGTRPTLRDPTAALAITEGEKKSAKADQEGFPCIGLVGVYGWCKKRLRDANGKSIGDFDLIDDLAAIPWQGRGVFITYDSDIVSKPDVQRAEFSLAECLARHGADVRVVRLPAEGEQCQQ